VEKQERKSIVASTVLVYVPSEQADGDTEHGGADEETEHDTHAHDYNNTCVRPQARTAFSRIHHNGTHITDMISHKNHMLWVVYRKH